MNVDPKKYRLGNLLREVNSGKIVEVIGLKKEIASRVTKFLELTVCDESITLEVSGNFTEGWRLEEIPLTEEILLKLGFVKDNTLDKIYYCPQTMRFDIINASALDGGFKFKAFRGSYILSEPILYISEIQNFFFCSAGKELDVSALKPETIPAP